MIKRGVESIAGTWLAGLLVRLPLALTLAALAWALSLVNRLLGSGSLVGQAFAALGYPFGGNGVAVLALAPSAEPRTTGARPCFD